MKILLCFICLLSAGCTTANLQKIPSIDADAFVYERHDPVGGTVITAKNVKTDGAGNLTADEAEWNTTYPQFGLHVKVIGYKQSASTKP